MAGNALVRTEHHLLLAELCIHKLNAYMHALIAVPARLE